MTDPSLPAIERRFYTELLGTALLLATIVGSGIMADKLANGNNAIALLCNSAAVGAMLYVLINMLTPLSGAHFNPVVSGMLNIEGSLSTRDLWVYVVAQVLGAIVGVWAAHLMFDEPLLQISHKARSGPFQWVSEFTATFGLLTTLLLTRRNPAASVAAAVGLYIFAAFWFTASTSFANPAVTTARSLTGTFTGIQPADVVPFVISQFLGAYAALRVVAFLTSTKGHSS
jgi:glycerol uptake facilitator-like aquaporin